MKDPLVTLQGATLAQSGVLYMALELSGKKWKVGLSDGARTSQHTIDAGEVLELPVLIGKAKARFKLSAEAKVKSCYEAGRDGFWLHRGLEAQGIDNVVVDSASIEVNRRARRAKTDRLDTAKLLSMLIRHTRGEPQVWRVLRIPSEEQEDARRVHRELERLGRERTQHNNRIRALLVLHNLRVQRVGGRDWEAQLAVLSAKLGAHLRGEIERESQRLKLVDEQIKAVHKVQRAQLEEELPSDRDIVGLLWLCGVGQGSAWVLVREFFGWREFGNQRQVGSAAGLTGTPYSSGESAREQGISKAGNKRIRWLMIELAWSWLRYQPESELSLWFQQRFGAGNKRQRRIGIVALARRLLIALWRYLKDGVIPAGAKLKAV